MHHHHTHSLHALQGEVLPLYTKLCERRAWVPDAQARQQDRCAVCSLCSLCSLRSRACLLLCTPSGCLDRALGLGALAWEL